jgi:hypothetical protein
MDGSIYLSLFYTPDLAPREYYPTFGIRARLGGLSVVGVEEEQRKKEKKKGGEE